MSQAQTKQGSFLAADFGSVNTRVILIDIVDGEYRVIARAMTPSTRYPIDDVGIGLRRVLQDITAATGRTFFNANDELIMPEQSDRAGIDAFATTASAGRPLRAVLVGLLPDVSLQSALRAINDAYVEPVAQLHLKDGMSEEERLNAIILSRPDLIFITGGTDGGAESSLLDILQVVRLAVQVTEPDLRPVVLYAGNARVADRAKKLFEGLTTLFIADNIRPTMEEEVLEAALRELGRAYDVFKERRAEGFGTVAEMSSTGILPTAQSYTLIAQYFAHVRGMGNVMAVDMGSSTTVLAGVFGDHVDTSISTNLGVGQSAPYLVEQLGEEKIAQWLPFYPQPGELLNYALNKMLRPATIPLDQREIFIEHAFVRAGIAQLVEISRRSWQGIPKTGELPSVNLIIAGGAPLTGTGNPAYTLMLLADALRPNGMTEVMADPHGLIPALGAMARLNPSAVAQLLDGDHLEHVGTILSVTGIPTPERTAIKLKYQFEEEKPEVTEIKGGHLVYIALPPNLTMNVELILSRGLTMDGKRRIVRKLSGGTGGILIDARGRPFATGDTPTDRARLLNRWLNEATDLPLLEIPPEWLEEPEPEPDIDALVSELEASQKTQRRGFFSFFRRKPAPIVEDDFDLADLEEPEVPKAKPTGELKKITGLLDPEIIKAKDQERQKHDDEGSLRDLL